MTIKYLDSKRISGLTTDFGVAPVSDDLTTDNGWVFPTNSSYDSTNDQIDLTIASNSFDVSYIDLQKAVYFGSGNNLNDDNFVIRARITKNNDLGNTSKGGSLLLQVSSALTDSSKSPNPQDAIGMRIDTDRTSSNAFYVHSVTNGRFWDGESSGISYTWGTGDLYWEIIGNGSTVTGELFTGSDYSTGSLGKVSTTQVAHTGMRYLKFCGFNDPSRTATQFSLQDFKIWNGVSSIPTKPTNVQDNSILVEKDTANRYWRTPESTSDVTWDDSTDVGCSISGNTVTKTSGNSWTSGVAKTDEVISASSGGTITMTSNAINTYIGLSNVATLNQQAKHWYDVKLGFNQNSVIENGAIVSPDTAFTRVTSDTMKITVSSAGLVKYYINDVLKHTSTITASGTYFGIFSAYNTNETLTATITTPATWTMNPTYESDFSTNAGWTNNGNTSVGQVNTTTKVLDAIGNVSTLCGVTRDLGAVDSTFLLRFKLGITVATQYTGGATSAKVNIGLFSSDYDGRASQELIALDVNAFDNSYRFKAGGAITPDGGGDTGAGNYGVETRWVEIKRLASGDCKLTIFTDEYSTEEGSKTSTPSGTITSALRYLGVKSGNTGSGDGNNALTVDDIEFYNGVTSIN